MSTPTTPKYYHVINCNRVIQAGPLGIRFTPYEHTGTWLGVYAATDAREIAELDKLAAAGKITEMTPEEYATAIKKKTSASSSYAPSLAVSTPTPGAAAAAPSAGEPIDTNPAAAPAEAPAAPLADIAEAITPVPVEPKQKAK